MCDKLNLDFPVTLYGNLEKFTQTISKGRCRIFYKYGNRNGTYITDDFAEKLISSLPYTPVKGIYDQYDEDYTDHGIKRDLGRIYGIVPENPNFAWEEHLDEDGVKRIYACTDVLIFTALYEEASEILGKGQSMELYPPSLQYHYEFIQGKKWLVFDEGCFLGLQVLGDVVEPCFEGAAFYDLKDSIEEVMNKIKEYALNYQSQGGHTEVINFKLSDDEKFSALWSLLNSEYNEEGNWTLTYALTSVYDDYALAYNIQEDCYERIYYTKNDEENSVVINEKVKVYIVDITEKEKTTLDTLRQLNGETYELVDEDLINAKENSQKVCEFSTKIEELTNEVSTLKTEKEESVTQYQTATDTISTLTEELTGLKEYKANIENANKQAVIAEYTEQLSVEVLDSYKEKLDNYTAEELDKELAYELKKTNPSVFSKNPQYIPRENQLGGIENILARYKK